MPRGALSYLKPKETTLYSDKPATPPRPWGPVPRLPQLEDEAGPGRVPAKRPKA